MTTRMTIAEQQIYPEGYPDEFQEPVSRFVFNAGISGASYDADTGMSSNFGRGIFEFRIGDEVVNVNNGKRDVITAIIPDRKGRPGMTRLEFSRGRACLLHVVRPTNPDRGRFGFVVRTSMVMENGKPTGGASRFATRALAELEVQRLILVGYPGAIQVLDSE